MNCQQCREECERLLDESLPIEQRSEIEANISAHIDTCPECAGEFALVQNLRLTLPQMQTALVEPPTFLRANIRAALVEEAQAKSQKKFAFALPLWTRSMWAGGLVLAFGFVMMSQQLIQFSEPPIINDTKSEERSDSGDQTAAPNAAMPPASVQTKKQATQKPQLSERNANKADSEVLPERIPAPRQKVFSAPTPSVSRPQPLVLPKVRIEKEKTSSPEQQKEVTPTKPSVKNAPATHKLTPPVREQAPAPRPVKDLENPTPQSPTAAMKPVAPDAPFMARSNADNRTPEKAVGGGMDAMASATVEVAPPDWRNGKITLAVVPPPLRGALSAKSVNNAANNAPEVVAPPAPITNAPATKSADNATNSATNRPNEAKAENDNNAGFSRSREPKIARGGGEFRMGARPIAPAYANPQTVAPSVQNAAPAAVIPRKLTLQSEFAVPNARLLQNGNEIWQGDLPAKKPVTIEWMTPINNDEKISFVLEQIGANGESNRKSLNLGD